MTNPENPRGLPTVETDGSRSVDYFRKREVSSNTSLSLYDNTGSGHTSNLGMAMFGIETECAIEHQRTEKERIKSIGTGWHKPKPKPRRKAITRKDIEFAVDSVMSEMISDLRRQAVDLPKWKQAIDYAIAIVQKHKLYHGD